MDQNLVPGKELTEDLLGAGEDWNYLRFQMAQNAVTNQQQLFEQQQWFGESARIGCQRFLPCRDYTARPPATLPVGTVIRNGYHRTTKPPHIHLLDSTAPRATVCPARSSPFRTM